MQRGSSTIVKLPLFFDQVPLAACWELYLKTFVLPRDDTALKVANFGPPLGSKHIRRSL